MSDKENLIEEENNLSEEAPETAEEELKEEVAATDETAELKAENAKLKDAYLRACAESENVKKRCQQEIEKNTKFTSRITR